MSRKLHRSRGSGKDDPVSALCAANSAPACYTKYIFVRSDRVVPPSVWRSLPCEIQCRKCAKLTNDYAHGDHRHLMAVELLCALLQRLWQAREEVGHRCYVALFQHPNGTPAGYRRCSCGRGTLVDEKTRTHLILGAMSSAEDGEADVVRGDCERVVLADGTPDRGNWCRECLRVRGTKHRSGCIVGIVRAASNDIRAREAVQP